MSSACRRPLPTRPPPSGGGGSTCSRAAPSAPPRWRSARPGARATSPCAGRIGSPASSTAWPSTGRPTPTPAPAAWPRCSCASPPAAAWPSAVKTWSSPGRWNAGWPMCRWSRRRAFSSTAAASKTAMKPPRPACANAASARRWARCCQPPPPRCPAWACCCCSRSVWTPHRSMRWTPASAAPATRAASPTPPRSRTGASPTRCACSGSSGRVNGAAGRWSGRCSSATPGPGRYSRPRRRWRRARPCPGSPGACRWPWWRWPPTASRCGWTAPASCARVAAAAKAACSALLRPVPRPVVVSPSRACPRCGRRRSSSWPSRSPAPVSRRHRRLNWPMPSAAGCRRWGCCRAMPLTPAAGAATFFRPASMSMPRRCRSTSSTWRCAPVPAWRR